MKLILVIFSVFFCLNLHAVVPKDCDSFQMSLDGSEVDRDLGRRFYGELVEELEVLSLEVQSIDICSYKCSVQIESDLECEMRYRLVYSYFPHHSEESGSVYCKENYAVNRGEDPKLLDEECELIGFE